MVGDCYAVISSNAMRYFAEVVRSGSFRSAAENLFVAPSAISRQISLIEEDLGAPVLDRGRGRGLLKLTAAGEILIQFVKAQDSEMERVRSDIEALKGLQRGHVRFGIPETLARDFIPDFLVGFNQRFPRITFEVQVHGTPRLVQLVASHELDAALTFNPPLQRDVTHVYERSLPTRLLVAAGHPLFDRESVRLSDCADYLLALPDSSISAKRFYDDMFVAAKIRPRSVLVTNSYEMMRSVAMRGLAISLVNEPLGATGDIPATYRYIHIKDARVKPQRLTLCLREGRTQSTVTLAFVEYLVQTLKEQAKTK